MMAGKQETLGETLTRHYRLSCELFSTFPQPHFTLQLSRGSLELRPYTLDLDHLEALCHTIKNKISPSHLRIYVPIEKEAAARVVERAVEGAAVCVVASLTITSLALDGVRLQGRTLKLLCEGVRKARTLKTLHIGKCGLGDSGTESMCQAIKNVPSITHLSLVDCGVEERGAIAIACLIKHQRLNRDSAMWQDTLRQRQPCLDGMKGLRRLTLNNNPALGDQGAAAIAEVLTEDLWIKAVDLQHCGLGVGSGASLCALLHSNQILEVVDVRNNPFLPDKVLGELTDLLQGRQTEATTQVEGESVEGYQKGGGPTVSYRASGRTVRGRKARHSPRVPSSGRKPKVPSQLGVPWRVEHRLFERREGLAPGSMVKEYFGNQQQSTGEVSQPPRESSSEGEVTMMKMRRKLHHYRKKYQKEHECRRKLERKLSKIQTQLKGLHTLDEATITHIEECFLRFQIYLSMTQNSREQFQTSSSAAADPLPNPPEPDSIPILPGNSLSPGTFFPSPPCTIPVPVIFQQPYNETTSKSHPVLTAPFHSMQERHHETKRTGNESEFLNQNKDGAKNLNALTNERNPANQDHSIHGSNGELSKENNYNLATVASHQHLNNLPGYALHNALYGRNSRDEDLMKQEQTTKKMLRKVIRGKQRKEEITNHTEENDPVPSHSSTRLVKQTQTVGTQVTNDIIEWNNAEVEKSAIIPEPSSPTNIDAIAMRMEFVDLNGRLKTGRTKCTNKKESNNMEDDREHETSFQSGDLSLKTSKIMEEIHTQKEQGDLKDNSPGEIKLVEKTYASATRSSGIEANPTPQGSQSLKESHSLQSSQSFQASQLLKSRQPPSTSHSLENSQSLQLQGSQSLPTSQSYSNHLPYEIKFVEESQLPQQSPSSPRQLPQLIQSYQESHSPKSHSFSSQSPPSQSPHSQSPHSQSPHSQSPHSQIPSSQPPQENLSPKRNQLHQKHSLQKLKSKIHSSHEGHLSKEKSPKKQLHKKSKSPKEESSAEVQASEVSETDDEKMRNLSAWLYGRMGGRTSSPSSSSSLSISEQLRQSHSSWTKGHGCSNHKEGRKEVEGLPRGREVEGVHGESEFEFDASDLEDLSISGITLTNTSVPEDLHTHGEEDF